MKMRQCPQALGFPFSSKSSSSPLHPLALFFSPQVKTGQPVIVGGVGTCIVLAGSGGDWDVSWCLAGSSAGSDLLPQAMDISARPFRDQDFIEGTSNPGIITLQWGGVGRYTVHPSLITELALVQFPQRSPDVISPSAFFPCPGISLSA